MRNIVPMLVYVVVVIVMLLGWGLNIYKFCKCDFEAPYKAEVIRGVSIFVFPMSAVTGYIDIADGNVVSVNE